MNVLEQEELKTEIEMGQWKISSKYGVMSSPNNKTLILEPRLSKLLYLLSLNVNAIVSREYLVNNIWKDTIVNEDSLTRAIADLRKLLSNNFENTVVINTIPKRGYILSIKTGPKLYALKLKLNNQSGSMIIGFVFLLLTILFLVAS